MTMDLAATKTLALLFFFLFFCGVVLWTFSPRLAERFRRDAALPLDEGRHVSPDDPSNPADR